MSDPIHSDVSGSFEEVTRNASTANEFLKMLDPSHETWGEAGTWIYRGQNDARWRLMPKFCRDSAFSKVPYSEIGMVRDFIRNVNRVNLKIPNDTMGHASYINGKKIATQRRVYDSNGDFLMYDYTHIAFAIAQHSGIPTRLLDFTHDPYVAAYFAAETQGLESKLGYSAEYKAKCFDDIVHTFMQTSDANATVLRYLRIFEERQAQWPKEIVVWAVRMEDMHTLTALRLLDHPFTEILNLRAQQGAFIMDIDLYDTDVDDVELRAFDSELLKLVKTKGVRKLTLPMRELAILRTMLFKKGYYPARMTPSYEHVAQNVVKFAKDQLENLE